MIEINTSENSPPSRLAPSWSIWLWAALAALAAGAIRYFAANQRGFWLDEYYTLNAARMDWVSLTIERLNQGHSPIYFYYARLWLLLFGESERALRASSALMASAAVLMMTGLAMSLGLRKILKPLWAILVVLPYWITAGTEYRYMMAVIAAAAGTAWALARFFESRRALAGLLAAALAGLMLSLHGAANYTLAGMGIWALCEGQSRERRWNARALTPLWPILAGWAMSLPLLLSIHPNHGPGGFTWPSLDGALRDLCEVVFANPRLWTRFLHLPWQVVWAAQLAALGGAACLGWRALSAPEGSPARRFIFSLLAGIPLGAMIAQFFHSSAMGPARYMAAFSVPASLCLAVAWGAPPVRRWERMYRGLLIFVLALQAAGAALDRGDRHREGVHWILAHRRADEPVIVSTSGMNFLAFEYLAGGKGGKAGMSGKNENITGIHGRIRDPEQVKDALRRAFAPAARRGFLFLYHTRSPILEALGDLRREGWAADYKTWKIGSEVEVVALILDPSERQWLDSLPPPRKLWGPDSSRE